MPKVNLVGKNVQTLQHVQGKNVTVQGAGQQSGQQQIVKLIGKKFYHILLTENDSCQVYAIQKP